MLSLTVTEDVRALFPDATLCVVEVNGARNSGSLPPVIVEALAASEEQLRSQFGGQPAQSHPSIAVWRDAYRAFGTNPSKNKPTIEALARRVLADKPLPNISAIVNAYLIVELEFLVPCGGYDLNLLDGPVVLRTSDGGEKFRALGAAADEIELTAPGEVVYADAERALTRHWNHRDSEDAKVSVNTTDFVLVFEVLPGVLSPDECEELIVRTQSLIIAACGGDSAHRFVRL